MKHIAIFLLLVIAAGVMYLAVGEYRKRQALSDYAFKLSDPKGWAAESFAKKADLSCDLFLDIETTAMKSRELRPIKFTCYSKGNGFWTVIDRPCKEGERISTGSPKFEGQVFKPYVSLCWELKKQ